MIPQPKERVFESQVTKEKAMSTQKMRRRYRGEYFYPAIQDLLDDPETMTATPSDIRIYSGEWR